MRLKSFNASIKNVVEVTAAVESRSVFNGSKRRSFEPCKNGTIKPNALVFTFGIAKPEGMNLGIGGVSTLAVGNLPPETVDRILDSMLTKGFADISTMSYQKLQLDVSAYKFDGGKSIAPYYYEGYNVFTHNPGLFGGGVAAFSPGIVAGEDLESMDDDSLRKRIYDISSYTMDELVAMDREGLEKVYDGILEGEDEPLL